MSNFEIKRISSPDSVNAYFKLIKNGRSLFDEFEAEIKKGGNYSFELAKIGKFMKADQQGQDLPDGSKKQLKRDKNDGIVDFEFRTKNLRLYGFKDDVGNIIILGGKNDKKEQVQDIARMRGIKKEYIKWKNENK